MKIAVVLLALFICIFAEENLNAKLTFYGR